MLQFARPSAILVSNGVMAIGALQAFEELGVRCPEDVAIANFDDIPGGNVFHPQLTVLAQPGYEIGSVGATLLMDRIEGRTRKKPSVVRMAPTLIVRESTRSRLPSDGNIAGHESASYQPKAVARV
jgi:LacI family transcriptional regulator